MLKIAVILLVAFAIFRWAFGFWPWELARGPDTGVQRIKRARRLLGVSARADRTEVLAAHRLAITRVHPDRGGSSERVHEVDEARDILLAELGEPPLAGGGAHGESREDESRSAGSEREQSGERPEE